MPDEDLNKPVPADLHGRNSRHAQDVAVTQLDEALRLSRSAGHRRTEAQATYRMGEALVAQGKLRAAGEALRGALTVVRDDGDRIGQLHVLRSLSRMHLTLSQLANAEYCGREAMTLAREVGDQQTADQIHSELVTIVARTGARAMDCDLQGSWGHCR